MIFKRLILTFKTDIEKCRFEQRKGKILVFNYAKWKNMKTYLLEMLLKTFRKFYSIKYPDSMELGRNWRMYSDREYANDLIYKKLIDNNPCMVARFGSAELLLIFNYLGIKYSPKYKSYKKFIKGQGPAWWWERTIVRQIQTNAGFFPNDLNKIKEFCELMIKDITLIDILGSWRREEIFFETELKKAKRVVLEDLEPFFAKKPWTLALENKKVLIIHPFIDSIKKQYEKRDLIFENNLLPSFHLKTIKAVQTIAGEITHYSDWFQALNFMKKEIDSVDYDICIIGAGAYGLPLAAHVKRNGKKAVHLGGVTQLLFGIKGARWEKFNFLPYMNLFNEYWIRPAEHERPKNANQIEGGCYW